MKKKILSYVLAVALTMSSFAGASFAVNIGEEAAKVGSGVASGGTLTPNKGIKFVPNKETQAETDKIVGLITQVFNYAFGVLTTVVDANRSITVFDEGRVRATYGYNPGNGSYTLTGFSLFGGNKDLGKINAAGGIENFLKKMGASDAMLTTEKQKFTVGDDGSVSLSETPETMDDYQSEKVAWLGTLLETLQKGVNHSVSINFVAEGGATLTVAENGKPQYVLGPQSDADGNPVILSKYIYNAGGFLVARSDLTYEVKDGPNQVTKDEKTGKSYSASELNDLAGQNDANLEFVATHHITYYDVFGRESYKTNSVGDILSRNSYSSNGAINFTNDLTNNTRTYYENGRQSFTVNEEGYTTQKYNYHQNGTLDTIVSYNYGVATQTTVFDFGKQLGTISNANDNTYTSNDIRAAYYKMMRSDSIDEMKQIYKAFNFVSTEFYAEFLGNQALLEFFGLDAAAKERDMREDFAKAEKLLKEAEQTMNELKLTDEEQKAIDTLGSSKATEDEKKAAEEILKNSTRASNYYKARQQASESKTKLENKEEKIAAAKRDINKALFRMKNCNNGYSSVASIAGAINNSVEEEIGESKDGGTSTRNADGGTYTTSKTLTKVTTVEKETLSFTITVKDRGQNAFSMQGATHTLSEKRTDRWDTSETTSFVADPPASSDPALIAAVETFVVTDAAGNNVGFYETDENGEYVLDANGEKIALTGEALKEAIKTYLASDEGKGAKVYAQVTAESINMLDGGNFHDEVAGETIYVELGADQLDLFDEGERVMFMGDVQADSFGKYVMNIRTDYDVTVDGVQYNGYAKGDAVDKVKDAIEAGTGLGPVLQENIEKNRTAFGLNDPDDYLTDWEKGWDILREVARQLL